jgi:hypothetical protein
METRGKEGIGETPAVTREREKEISVKKKREQ